MHRVHAHATAPRLALSPPPLAPTLQRLTASCCSARSEFMPWCVQTMVCNDSPSTQRYRVLQAECMCNASYDAWRVSRRWTSENAGKVPQLTQGGASLRRLLHLSETDVRCIRNKREPRCIILPMCTSHRPSVSSSSINPAQNAFYSDSRWPLIRDVGVTTMNAQVTF